MELNPHELSLLAGIRSGRSQRVDQITDVRSLETLKRKGLVFIKPGRPTMPRTGAEFSQSFRRHGVVSMVQHDEAHLTVPGQHEYSLYFRRDGLRRQRDEKLLNRLIAQANAEPDNVLVVTDRYFETAFGMRPHENEFRPTIDKWANRNDLLCTHSRNGDEWYLIKRLRPSGLQKLLAKREERKR